MWQNFGAFSKCNYVCGAGRKRQEFRNFWQALLKSHVPNLERRRAQELEFYAFSHFSLVFPYTFEKTGQEALGTHEFNLCVCWGWPGTGIGDLASSPPSSFSFTTFAFLLP